MVASAQITRHPKRNSSADEGFHQNLALPTFPIKELLHSLTDAQIQQHRRPYRSSHDFDVILELACKIRGHISVDILLENPFDKKTQNYVKSYTRTELTSFDIARAIILSDAEASLTRTHYASLLLQGELEAQLADYIYNQGQPLIQEVCFSKNNSTAQKLIEDLFLRIKREAFNTQFESKLKSPIKLASAQARRALHLLLVNITQDLQCFVGLTKDFKTGAVDLQHSKEGKWLRQHYELPLSGSYELSIRFPALQVLRKEMGKIVPSVMTTRIASKSEGHILKKDPLNNDTFLDHRVTLSDSMDEATERANWSRIWQGTVGFLDPIETTYFSFTRLKEVPFQYIFEGVKTFCEKLSQGLLRHAKNEIIAADGQPSTFPAVTKQFIQYFPLMLLELKTLNFLKTEEQAILNLLRAVPLVVSSQITQILTACYAWRTNPIYSKLQEALPTVLREMNPSELYEMIKAYLASTSTDVLSTFETVATLNIKLPMLSDVVEEGKILSSEAFMEFGKKYANSVSRLVQIGALQEADQLWSLRRELLSQISFSDENFPLRLSLSLIDDALELYFGNYEIPHLEERPSFEEYAAFIANMSTVDFYRFIATSEVRLTGVVNLITQFKDPKEQARLWAMSVVLCPKSNNEDLLLNLVTHHDFMELNDFDTVDDAVREQLLKTIQLKVKEWHLQQRTLQGERKAYLCRALKRLRGVRRILRLKGSVHQQPG